MRWSDWVFEPLSPSPEKYDKGDKRTIYAHCGVRYLWYLDPRSKSLETFRRADKCWTLTGMYSDADEECAPPFDVLNFSLALLWPFDAPPAAT
jgi:Uma2 family endonuclease